MKWGFAPRWSKPCLYRFLWFKGVTINDILFIIPIALVIPT
ncbi:MULTISPECIES: hypothetical protein [unclassified Commensalibacter]|nr:MULTISPECIES: hypothetical protein [unclassified Commensalibacter]